MSTAATTVLKQAKAQVDQPAVLFENCGKLINAILNKPNTLNALDLDIFRALSSEIPKWNQSPQIQAVTFKGAGGRAFCAGGQIKSVYYARHEPLDTSFLDYFFREAYTTYYQISTMKPIQMTIWDGLAIGGGVGISLLAPIKIATEKASCFMPEAKLGLHLNMGGGYLFSRMQNNLGYFLGLTGYSLKGEEIVQCGIADYYVKSENLPELEAKIKETTNQLKEVSIEELRKIVKKYAEPVEKRYKNEEFISQVFGKPTLEGICKELEKQSTENELAKDLFERVKANSPMGMKIIYEQLKRGSDIDYRESLKVDMRLTKKILASNELFEGIRCVLVDRGDQPKWIHSSLQDISDQEVDNYFKPLPDHLELQI